MTPKTQDQPANIAAPEVKGGSAATIGSAYYRLFEHMSRTHDLTLTDSELADIWWKRQSGTGFPAMTWTG